MITESQYECPVCKGAHPTLGRIVGFNILACAELTPPGETRFLAAHGVIVVGAGEGVDRLPAKPATITDLQARKAELERQKLAREAPAGPSAEDLDADIAALEKELGTS